MKQKLAIFAVAVITVIAASPAIAETSVGVSIGIRQPGVYGRIDIGDVAPPPVIYAQPVIISLRQARPSQQPVYLYVPPGHQKNWRRHCRSYGACGQPVYFVEERWVEERYEERHPGKGHRGGKGNKGNKGDRDHGNHGGRGD